VDGKGLPGGVDWIAGVQVDDPAHEVWVLTGCAAMTAEPNPAGLPPLSTTLNPDTAPTQWPRPFDDLVQQLVDDCTALGVHSSVTRRVRVALRRRLQLSQWKRLLLIATPLALILLALPLLGAAVQTKLATDGPAWWPGRWYFHWLEKTESGKAFEITIIAGGLMWWIGLLLTHHHEIRRRRSQASRIFLARRYALVTQCAEAIHVCAEARRGGEQRAERFKSLSKKLKAVRRGVLDAHSSRGTVPLFSHRRKRLKLHERKVCSALEEIESKLDSAPADALRELAETLLTIADRYCQGRIGNLLNDEQLSGVNPQRNWEVMRYFVALTLAAGGIIGLGSSSLIPDGAESFVFGIVFVAAFLVAFGRNFRRYIDVISAITGGP
jgi:hypothetical protein